MSDVSEKPVVQPAVAMRRVATAGMGSTATNSLARSGVQPGTVLPQVAGAPSVEPIEVPAVEALEPIVAEVAAPVVAAPVVAAPVVAAPVVAAPVVAAPVVAAPVVAAPTKWTFVKNFAVAQVIKFKDGSTYSFPKRLFNNGRGYMPNSSVTITDSVLAANLREAAKNDAAGIVEVAQPKTPAVTPK